MGGGASTRLRRIESRLVRCHDGGDRDSVAHVVGQSVYPMLVLENSKKTQINGEDLMQPTSLGPWSRPP